MVRDIHRPKKHKICVCTAYIVGTTEICPTKHLIASYQQWKTLSTQQNNHHPREQAISDLTKKTETKNKKWF